MLHINRMFILLLLVALISARAGQLWHSQPRSRRRKLPWA